MCVYLSQRAGTAEPSYTLHCRLQLSDRHPAYYPNWPINHFRRQDWGQCSREVFLRLSELYDEPWYGVYMTAMTINMSRHALSHMHHEMWRHKNLSNWKRHVTDFRTSVHTHIKWTAKLLLLIMTVIDCGKKEFRRIRFKNGQENKIEWTELSPHETCTTDFLSRESDNSSCECTNKWPNCYKLHC